MCYLDDGVGQGIVCVFRVSGCGHMNILRIMGGDSEDEGGGKEANVLRDRDKRPWMSVLGETELRLCVFAWGCRGVAGQLWDQRRKECGMKDD